MGLFSSILGPNWRQEARDRRNSNPFIEKYFDSDEEAEEFYNQNKGDDRLFISLRLKKGGFSRSTVVMQVQYC